MNKQKSLLIIVVGMPGSGKTTLINSLKDDKLVAFDNILANEALLIPAIYHELEQGRDCICSDIMFCDEVILSRFVRKFYRVANIQRFYFSNDPHQCKLNAIRRDGRQLTRQLELIEELSKHYRPPVIIQVYKPEASDNCFKKAIADNAKAGEYCPGAIGAGQ